MTLAIYGGPMTLAKSSAAGPMTLATDTPVATCQSNCTRSESSNYQQQSRRAGR